MINGTPPIVFLGMADRVISDASYPYARTDFINIGLAKNYLIYPTSPHNAKYIFIVHNSFTKDFFDGHYELVFKRKAKIIWETSVLGKPPKKKGEKIKGYGYLKYQEWISFEIPAGGVLIEEPGVVAIFLRNKKNKEEMWLSEIIFTYNPQKPLNANDVQGIRSRLMSYKEAKLEIKCTSCNQKFPAYTGLSRSTKLENDGCIWQSDLPEYFRCKCGKVNAPLRYCKESMHALLFQKFLSAESTSTQNLYSKNSINSVVGDFIGILQTENNESVIQRFIEENPVMLCMFNAKKVFNKPEIIGNHQADFAVLDANNNLIFIEIERPKMRLFKRNGHETADLNHAYSQVSDWLFEIRRSKNQVLEKMELSEKDINKITGFVIAGIKDNENKVFYNRHQQKNENKLIGFISLDELATAVLNMSRSLEN
ncbi:Shedu anti-phage system protein SduA domain-containing protein [Cellvibrio sp. PSBB006]|uniref:Shedu anti-phage system protein SduA domain-containing protein n=1 Tax=Cellvibrio sp. PSBB006 TaxID=1987723 RepID=UPI000B3B94A1|nr:Shedu anti-phage system protein SduA domain-containing protein [Cellvibrio sp. PSBB006]ARU27790.1 hypothetical protein CBR65_10325 [Cellvibrio sp. PSBB006]